VETKASRLERTWKTLTLVGAIAAAGFGASTYLGGFQTAAGARSEHASIREEMRGSDARVAQQIERHAEELRDVRYVNVRIEVAQAQVLDELRLARQRAERAVTAAEREERQATIEELERRIEVRGGALEQSYERRPTVPHDASQIDPEDPLTRLGGAL
jgi:hypothetical protein